MEKIEVTIPGYISERIINNKLCIINQKLDEVWIYSNHTIGMWNKLKNKEIDYENSGIFDFINSLQKRKIIDSRLAGEQTEDKKVVPYNKTIQLSYEAYKSHTIYNALIELTYKCNENCQHCYITSTPQNELSLEEIKSLFDQLREMGCHQLFLTGGEIFCRRDIFEILDYAQSKGFLIGLFTNATLLTPDMIDKLTKYYFSFIKISLYGITPGTHDKVTKVSGSFHRTVNNIKLLKQKNLNVKAGFMLFKENAKELLNAEEFCSDLGVKHSIDMKIFPAHDNSERPLDYSATDEDLITYLKKGKVDPIKRIICLAGQIKIKINSEGEVFPCEFWRDPVGNLREQPLKEIWDSEKLKEIVNKIRNFKPAKCSKCDLTENCFICPAFVDFDSEEVPNRFCKWSKLYSTICTS